MRTPDSSNLTFGANTAENEQRLAELLLYVVEQCEGDSRFGATKLNKILYYADFYSFARTGKPLTGVEYMRQPFGPVPRRVMPVREELVRKGDLDVSDRESFNGRRQTKFLAKRSADVSMFTSADLALVNEIIEYLRDQNAQQVSEGSHGRAWEVAQNGDLIPYESVFVSERGAVEADIAAIRKLGEKLDWRLRITRKRGSLIEAQVQVA